MASIAIGLCSGAARSEPVISAAVGRVDVRVIGTDEGVMVAKSVCHVLGHPHEKENEHGHEDEKA